MRWYDGCIRLTKSVNHGVVKIKGTNIINIIPQRIPIIDAVFFDKLKLF